MKKKKKAQKLLNRTKHSPPPGPTSPLRPRLRRAAKGAQEGRLGPARSPGESREDPEGASSLRAPPPPTACSLSPSPRRPPPLPPRAVRGRIPAAASPQRKVTRCGVRDAQENGRRERGAPAALPGVRARRPAGHGRGTVTLALRASSLEPGCAPPPLPFLRAWLFCFFFFFSFLVFFFFFLFTIFIYSWSLSAPGVLLTPPAPLI